LRVLTIITTTIMASTRSGSRPPPRAAATKITSLKEPGQQQRSSAVVQDERDEKELMEAARAKAQRRAARELALVESAAREEVSHRKRNLGCVYSKELSIPKNPQKRPQDTSNVDELAPRKGGSKYDRCIR
jgi:hypothetical protein